MTVIYCVFNQLKTRCVTTTVLYLPKLTLKLKHYYFGELLAWILIDGNSDLIAVSGICCMVTLNKVYWSFTSTSVCLHKQCANTESTKIRSGVCLTWQRIWIREQRLALTRLHADVRDKQLSCGRRRRCRAARVNKLREDRMHNSSPAERGTCR